MINFDSIIGGGVAKNLLMRQAKNKTPSHAYVISGVPGSGKKLHARAFAKALMCGYGGCGVCGACRVFESGNNPDIFYIRPKNSRSISVDDVRGQIVNNVEIKPFFYPYKIFIIENAELMTVQAQNALLKTLEEPPAYAVFVLCAENERLLLSTVLTRCVLLRTKPLPAETVFGILTAHYPGLDKTRARLYAELASGSPGKALALAGDDESPLSLLSMRDCILTVLEGLSNKDYANALLSYKVFEEFKERAGDALDLVCLWYRDVAACASGGVVIQKDIIGRVTAEAGLLCAESAAKRVELVSETKVRLAQNAHFQMAIESMLIKLKDME